MWNYNGSTVELLLFHNVEHFSHTMESILPYCGSCSSTCGTSGRKDFMVNQNVHDLSKSDLVRH